MKYAGILEYDGSDFSGWQSQPHARNVQDCVEAALSGVADERIGVTCAGRTDAGVHAVAQVVHFETEKVRTEDEWRRGANALLPPDISFHHVVGVAADFHARFSAQQRYYRYVIMNLADRRALTRHFSEHIHPLLDVEIMHNAAQSLLGEHDFSAFRAAGCQAKSPVRHISTISVTRSGDFVFVDVGANAFLQHMVRNIVGVLIAIGSGAAASTWAQQVLLGRDRTQGGMTVSGAGLYLSRVDYAEHYGLPPISSKSIPFSIDFTQFLNDSAQ